MLQLNEYDLSAFTIHAYGKNKWLQAWKYMIFLHKYRVEALIECETDFVRSVLKYDQ